MIDELECEDNAAHRKRMARGSERLLGAILEQRAPKHPKTIAEAIKARPKRRRKYGLWPRWYHPPQPGLSAGMRVVMDVASDFQLTVGDMTGKSRRELIVDARAVVVRILLERGWGCNQIARQLGRNDHSTVCNLRDNFPIYAARNGLVGWSYERQRLRNAGVVA